MKKILRAAAAAAIAALVLTSCAPEESWTPPEHEQECLDLAAPFAEPVAELEGVSEVWSVVDGPSCGALDRSTDRLMAAITMAPDATGADMVLAVDTLRDSFAGNAEQLTDLRMSPRFELPNGTLLHGAGNLEVSNLDTFTIAQDVAEAALSIDADAGPAEIVAWNVDSAADVVFEVPVARDPSDGDILSAVADMPAAWEAAAEAAKQLGIEEGHLRLGFFGENDADVQTSPEYYFYEADGFVYNPITVPVPAGSSMEPNPAWGDLIEGWYELLSAGVREASWEEDDEGASTITIDRAPHEITPKIQEALDRLTEVAVTLGFESPALRLRP